MLFPISCKLRLSAAVILLASGSLLAQSKAGAPPKTSPEVCAPCIRAHMEFLASDALRGRGSATPDELTAAVYAATELQRAGIAPAGDAGGYIQNVTLISPKATSAPQLEFSTASGQTTWTHGKEIAVSRLTKADSSGPLQRLTLQAKPGEVKPGAMLFLALPAVADFREVQGQLEEWLAGLPPSQGPAALLLPLASGLRGRWTARAAQMPSLPTEVEGVPPDPKLQGLAVVILGDEATSAVASLPEGTNLRLHASVQEEKRQTRNVIGKLEGTDPQQVILLTAHIDHLGVGRPVNGDDIYNGADDDASGSTAVLELARALAAGPRLRRTVLFVLFGSEELGALGSSYFRAQPPLPLANVSAYLEFEMLGRSDSAVPDHTLWMTGWDRTDLGPALAAHGAHLVGDPHPAQHFFERSDNYVFALSGMVAQSVGSYGLHNDYHRPSDDLSHIDFTHMTEAIGSLIAPVRWLANSDFTPHWLPGKKP